MKKVIFILVFFYSSIFCYSANSASGSSSGKITTLLWYEGHTGVLVQQESMSDLGGCGRSDYYILDDTHPYFKEIYSLLLSAHISLQPLSLYLDDCIQSMSRIKHVTSHK